MRAILGKVMVPTLYLGLAATSYTMVQCFSESTRQTKDSWNAAYGGMVCGFIIGGLTKKRFDVATAAALGTGLAMGLADLVGPMANYAMANNQTDDVDRSIRPKTFVESAELQALKEKYPKFKDL